MGYQDGIAFDFAQTTEELRAMALFYNWYVRDENVNDEINVPFTSGEDDPSEWWPNYDKASGMLKVNHYKDYFTSGQTSTLKGSPVPIPTFGGDGLIQPPIAPVFSGSTPTFTSSQNLSFYGDGHLSLTLVPRPSWATSDYPEVYRINSGDVLVASILLQNEAARVVGYFSGSDYILKRQSKVGGSDWIDSPGLGLPYTLLGSQTSTSSYADLSGSRWVPSSLAGAPLINDLRFAVQTELTKIMDQRRGNRYNEWGEAHFGSKLGDALIQIPQFVSSCKQRIRFNQVLQTSAATDDDPLGSYGGHAQVGDKLKIHWYCPEESILQVFAFIRPRPGYQQGAARWRSEITRFERYDTPYAHLGMQAVKGRELVVSNDSNFNTSDFCYQDIWDHHRHKPSRVSGLFRTSKAMWTSQRLFDPTNPPAFNDEFLAVTSADSSDRNFSAAGVAPWVVDVDCGLYVLSPLPKHGSPGYIDHVKI
jgi:hypothetical protein